MSKVTSKLQVTIPRSIANEHGIRPGSEIEFESAGEVIRIRMGLNGKRGPVGAAAVDAALRWFDAATRRQQARAAEVLARVAGSGDGRGWSREDLYAERTGR